MVKIDRELDAMEETLLRMGKKVAVMHERTMSLFVNNDKEDALQIITSDDFINKMEEDINDQAVASLALLSPVASDLRRVIAAIKIASELERIGDYAKNIAKFMIKHDEIDTYVSDYATAMQKHLSSMLEMALCAYEQRDIELAFSIPEKDKEIDHLLLELKTKIKEKDDIDIYRHLFSISSMLRSIERAGDHTINIAEHVIYLIKGQHYDFG